MTYCTTETVE